LPVIGELREHALTLSTEIVVNEESGENGCRDAKPKPIHGNTIPLICKQKGVGRNVNRYGRFVLVDQSRAKLSSDEWMMMEQYCRSPLPDARKSRHV
jgi:hypothetical protein